jgi:hypothetical protein
MEARREALGRIPLRPNEGKVEKIVSRSSTVITCYHMWSSYQNKVHQMDGESRNNAHFDWKAWKEETIRNTQK